MTIENDVYAKQDLKNLLIKENTQPELTKLPEKWELHFKKYLETAELNKKNADLRESLNLLIHTRLKKIIREAQLNALHNSIIDDSNYTKKEMEFSQKLREIIKKNHETGIFSEIEKTFENIDKILDEK